MDKPLDRSDLVAILKTFGEEMSQNKEKYYTSTVIVTSSEGILIEFTLYFLANQIPYEYRAINVTVNKHLLTIRFFTLSTKQSDYIDVDISNGTEEFKKALSSIADNKLFKAALEFLINQTNLKNEYKNTPILSQIIIGQARVAVLQDGERINVGWFKIDGEDVVYYTGRGLYDIWRPSMTKEEQMNAEHYKKLTEAELEKLGYMERRRISEFKSIE